MRLSLLRAETLLLPWLLSGVPVSSNVFMQTSLSPPTTRRALWRTVPAKLKSEPSSALVLCKELRGGATWFARRHFVTDPVAKTDTKSSPSIKSSALSKSVTIWIQQYFVSLTIFIAMCVALYIKRDSWQPWMDKDRIQRETLKILHQLQGDDKDSSPLKALTLYMVGMAAWETIGLSTIPVETAAAMVFGWKAMFPSAMGKLLGATIAFIAGKTLLYQWVKQHIVVDENSESNENPSLISLLRYNRQTPLQTALLMKFSVFPEFVKNYGTGVLFFDTVRLPAFCLATFLHGSSFTFLWTWLGVETVAELHGSHSATAPSWMRKIVFPGALAVGMALPFVLMAWWAKQLRDEQQRRRVLQRMVLPKRQVWWNEKTHRSRT